MERGRHAENFRDRMFDCGQLVADTIDTRAGQVDDEIDGAAVEGGNPAGPGEGQVGN